MKLLALNVDLVTTSYHLLPPRYHLLPRCKQYGLSPINVDRVDLQRFPRLADAAVYHVRLHPGDALYIPDGWVCAPVRACACERGCV